MFIFSKTVLNFTIRICRTGIWFSFNRIPYFFTSDSGLCCCIYKFYGYIPWFFPGFWRFTCSHTQTCYIFFYRNIIFSCQQIISTICYQTKTLSTYFCRNNTSSINSSLCSVAAFDYPSIHLVAPISIQSVLHFRQRLDTISPGVCSNFRSQFSNL